MKKIGMVVLLIAGNYLLGACGSVNPWSEAFLLNLKWLGHLILCDGNYKNISTSVKRVLQVAMGPAGASMGVTRFNSYV